MKLPAKSVKQNDVDIEDYYAIKIGSIWRGLKQESPAFWWLCLYLFLEYIRPAVLYPVIDILPWTQISLLFACYTAVTDKSIVWVGNTANKLVFLFLFIVLLSSVFAFSSSKAFDAIDIPILWVLAYVLITNIVNTEKRLIAFLLLFFLINLKMSSHGFLSYAARGFSYTRWGVIGSPGWFRDSGDFGIAMTIYSPLVLAFILALRDKWGKYKRWFFYYAAMSGFMTILATSSRGAQLGMVMTVVWFVFVTKKVIRMSLLAGVLGLIVYSMLPESMLDEYTNAGEDSTSENRLAHWAFGMEVVEDFPVLGVGYNNWLKYCDYMNPYGVVDDFRSRCLEPHNTYVEASSELGITGFILYLVLIIYTFVLNVRTRALSLKSGNKLLRYLAYGIDGGLVGYLVASIFFTVLFYPFFWMQLAITVALHNVAKRDFKEKELVKTTLT